MERFSLEKYLKNPNREVVYGEGKTPARILCTDLKGRTHPIVVAVTNIKGDEEFTYTCSENGEWNGSPVLFFKPEKRYVNFWRFGKDGEWQVERGIYGTVDEANEAVQEKFDILAKNYLDWDSVSVKTVLVEISED